MKNREQERIIEKIEDDTIFLKVKNDEFGEQLANKRALRKSSRNAAAAVVGIRSPVTFKKA